MVTATSDRGPRRFADAVWLVLSVGLIGFVARFGVDFPYMDEWPTVNALAAETPPVRWLWERHNEHVVAVPRLLYWGLFRLTGDLRTGMFVSAVGWAILARLLMAAARNARGRPAYADAAFPLLLLHFGQYENVLMSYQVCFALSALLLGVTLVVVVRPKAGLGGVLAVAGCTATLPLCGGHGLMFAGVGMAWLAAVAADRWVLPNGQTGRRTATAAVVGLLASLAATVPYAVLPTRPQHHTPSMTEWKFLNGWFGFEVAGYGLAAERLWPWSALVPFVVGVALIACLWRTRRRAAGPDRLPYLGLAAAAGIGLLLTTAVAWSRGRFGIHGVFFPRYVGLSAFVPVAAILAWVRFGRPALSKYGPAVVAVASAVLLPGNLWLGWRAGSELERVQASASQELADGVPVEVVARKYHFLIYNSPPAVVPFIEKYADAGLGRFRSVTHEPLSAVVPLSTTPTRVREVRPIGGERCWENTGPDGCLEFDVPVPTFAHAIVVRGKYRHAGFWPPSASRIEWWGEPGGPVAVQAFPAFRFPTPDLGDPALIAWVNGPVSGFRVVPDRGSWGFQVNAVELLAPPGPVTTNASTGTGPATTPR